MSVPFTKLKKPDGQYSVADPNQTLVRLPAPTQGADLRSAEAYPNTAERVLRFIRDVLAAVALAMVIVVLALAARFMVSVAAAIDQWRAESVAVDCPAGPGQCGG
jgi:hypothetical protein